MGRSKREYWERIHADIAPLSMAGRQAYVNNHGISYKSYYQAAARYGFNKKQRKAVTAGGFKEFVATGTEPMVVKLPGGCEIRIPAGDVASLRAVIEVCGGGVAR